MEKQQEEKQKNNAISKELTKRNQTAIQTRMD